MWHLRWRRRRRRTEHRWNLKISSSCTGRSHVALIITADPSMGPKPYLPPLADIGLPWSHIQNLILSTTFLKPRCPSLLHASASLLRVGRRVGSLSLSLARTVCRSVSVLKSLPAFTHSALRSHSLPAVLRFSASELRCSCPPSVPPRA